jgi:hypothetical protein
MKEFQRLGFNNDTRGSDRSQQKHGQKPTQREPQPGADQAPTDDANAGSLPNHPDTQNRDLNDQERENEEENSNNR